ncbi:hypothetical protein Taro_001867 [Colocasia esculenta]|uniref:Uncharacterized protein n=1 Tax=Colocasia esculenta TaxID=4460 RepID=A0A843THJ3_COLES|nr:hypothetical protein [Colocasia esculenta]
MTLGLINANPVVHAKKERISRTEDLLHAVADDAVDPLDTNSVRDIRDPEHPYSLEQLSVLSEESITVDEKVGRIRTLRNLAAQCWPPTESTAQSLAANT